MRTPGELRLVKDFNTTDVLSLLFGKHVEPTTYADLGKPEVLLTPYPGSQDPPTGAREATKVNLNTVDLLATEASTAVVLRALISGLMGSGGGTDQVVQDILDERRLKFQDGKQLKMSDVEQIVGNRVDKTKLKNVADVKSSYFRVEAEGRVGQDVRYTIKKRIIIVLKQGSSGSSLASRRGASPAPSPK
jgi:hypothetical protein